ncbi:unnamed protein product [Chrysodeixis includens]|uniref:Neugrin n=1 Tax=Chrysodeixis includens TaxID=689277 RepID=A0A9N8Q125_CHRIL|nr:unnamed protein product [Chrysodeixis includens]
MIALRLRHLYRTCDKVIIRNLRNRRLEVKSANPGLGNQIKAYEKDGLRVNEENVEEFIESSESDFFNVGQAYDDHMNETLMGKYELRHRIVRDKYFKENMPNLLTWSEKEQIRHLASTEPDEWTPEKIAESFPVTAPVVKKLLKYPWKPATAERIARHDASVMRNWKELKEGSPNIPPEIRKHFLKFSNRSIPPLKQESIKIDITPGRRDLGEFERIVRKCAEKETETTPNNNENTLVKLNAGASEGDDKFIQSKKRDPKIVTLEELTMKIKKRLDKGSKVDINDQMIAGSVNTGKKAVSVNIENELEVFNDQYEESGVVEFKNKADDPMEVMNYPERIRIPKKAYKKGATYKVNDCFYDHDGKFLYRVLGM